MTRRTRIFLSGFALLALLLAHADRAMAGTGTHGGIGVVCRSGGQVYRAEILDLWEPEILHVARNDGDVEVQVSAALERLSFSPEAKKNVVDELAYLQGIVRRVEKALPLSNDAFPEYGPDESKGCKYEQIALMGKDMEIGGKVSLKINGALLDDPKLSNTDRAALYLHEAIYSLDRAMNHATNSLRTRRIVSALFSTEELPSDVVSDLKEFFSGDRIAPNLRAPEDEIPAGVDTDIPPINAAVSVGRTSTGGLEAGVGFQGAAVINDMDSKHVDVPVAAQATVIQDSQKKFRDYSVSGLAVYGVGGSVKMTQQSQGDVTQQTSDLAFGFGVGKRNHYFMGGFGLKTYNVRNASNQDLVSGHLLGLEIATSFPVAGHGRFSGRCLLGGRNGYQASNADGQILYWSTNNGHSIQVNNDPGIVRQEKEIMPDERYYPAPNFDVPYAQRTSSNDIPANLYGGSTVMLDCDAQEEQQIRGRFSLYGSAENVGTPFMNADMKRDLSRYMSSETLNDMAPRYSLGVKVRF